MKKLYTNYSGDAFYTADVALNNHLDTYATRITDRADGTILDDELSLTQFVLDWYINDNRHDYVVEVFKGTWIEVNGETQYTETWQKIFPTDN